MATSVISKRTTANHLKGGVECRSLDEPTPQRKNCHEAQQRQVNAAGLGLLPLPSRLRLHNQALDMHWLKTVGSGAIPSTPDVTLQRGIAK
jgi:hypothetical protein